MSTLPITTVDEYIASLPNEKQDILRQIRKTIFDTVPDIKESISYNMPAYAYGDEKHFIFFAAWKNHISIYPIYNKGGKMKKELAPYMHEKDTLQLSYKEPFPYDLLEKVVKMKLEEVRK